VNVQAPNLQQPIRELALIDLQGKIIKTWLGNLGNEAIPLDVADQADGLYFLRVQFKNESYDYFKILLD
jgi:hypothetical protein